MADATLVCKGLVTDATPITSATDPPRMTGIATVHVDRCFKGDPPLRDVNVLFDSVLPAAGGPAIVLQKGDYYLFFLQTRGDKYFPFDRFSSLHEISRLQARPVHGVVDEMQLLEMDLKAGLKDPKQSNVLHSIQLLGDMRHLRSTRELKALLHSRYALNRTYVYEALLQVGDYSQLEAVRKFLATRPEAPGSIYEPQDRLLQMQFRLASQIGRIKDPGLLPQLERLLLSPHRYTRDQALQAVRAINSPHSAASLFELLDDPDVDIRFGAMQGLLSIAGGSSISWVPTWEEFRKNSSTYVAKCKDWWHTEGQYKACCQPPPGLRGNLFLNAPSH